MVEIENVVLAEEDVFACTASVEVAPDIVVEVVREGLLARFDVAGNIERVSEIFVRHAAREHDVDDRQGFLLRGVDKDVSRLVVRAQVGKL